MKERFPMSQLEILLKKYFLMRPELRNKILTNTELAEYIAWLIQTQKERPRLSAVNQAVPTLSYSPNLSGLAERIMDNPKDQSAFLSLAEGFETQQEERYLLANYDISISRMFRYMPAHWHTNDYFEIYYCFSGNCPIYFTDETIEMHPGTVLIVAPSVLHASPCYHDDSVLFYYMIRSSTFDKVFWNQLPPENLMSTFFRQALGNEKHASYLHFETDVDQDIERLLSRIYEEFCHPGNYSAQMLNTLMSEFFILLLRRYEGTARLPRTEDFYWKHEFSAIFSYIQTHYQDMTLAEIAAHFHYSERQVSRIVLSCTGMNYSQLILKLKMERAGRLLLRPNLSIEAISSAVGYSTLSSFYRAFARFYGCAPAEYRSRNQK